jgi:hypothetical protein
MIGQSSGLQTLKRLGSLLSWILFSSSSMAQFSSVGVQNDCSKGYDHKPLKLNWP